MRIEYYIGELSENEIDMEAWSFYHDMKEVRAEEIFLKELASGNDLTEERINKIKGSRRLAVRSFNGLKQLTDWINWKSLSDAEFGKAYQELSQRGD